ncbi:hypothetical protein D3M96_05960 [Alcaligenes aquatilis]|uniref:Uncharacterized protein n=1 Tax=Alcaligenes aquatilis TaxID=323284 RepID=A0A3G2HSU5_9BURK|nr:hypothetical protein D3M96_05960 [Alcaligenes aquatilis]
MKGRRAGVWGVQEGVSGVQQSMPAYAQICPKKIVGLLGQIWGKMAAKTCQSMPKASYGEVWRIIYNMLIIKDK